MSAMDNPVVKDKDWLGLNGFVWFIGVVEDRLDPLQLGRVKVRCHNWHIADKSKLPTENLPWAQIMIPATSASTSGIGVTPNGLIEGSWVIGFFLDGHKALFPMIMGTFHGAQGSGSTPSEGFNDPLGVYPKLPGDSDVSRLGRDYIVAETHTTMSSKRDTRETDIAIARKSKLTSVAHDDSESAYANTTWSEPVPRGAGGVSLYPLNHVTETESGHITEFDDSPGARRIHEYHAAGSFREIQDDGTRTTKIVGDDFEIVIKDKNVFVKGDCNVTIAGNAKLLIYGDMVTEVSGDYHLSVHGDRFTKINGNDVTEIGNSRSTNVTIDESILIGGNRDVIIAKNDSNNIRGSTNITVKSNMSSFNGGNTNIVAGSKLNLVSVSSMKIVGSRIDLNPA